MKFILAFSICSAINGFCNDTATLPAKFNYWSECVHEGGKLIVVFSEEMKTSIEENKLYLSYSCHEVKSNEKDS
jgi:hypothetical protein